MLAQGLLLPPDQNLLPPGSPGVGSVCKWIDDCWEPIHRDDDHHKTRDVESKNPAKKIGDPSETIEPDPMILQKKIGDPGETKDLEFKNPERKNRWSQWN